MDGLTLEPMAIRLFVSKSENETGEVFKVVAANLVETLVTLCLCEKQALIGHIKGFAVGTDGSYLRVSASGDGRAVDLEGEIADGTVSILLALNIHVFGIPAARIRELVAIAIKEATTSGKAVIAFVEDPKFETAP